MRLAASDSFEQKPALRASGLKINGPWARDESYGDGTGKVKAGGIDHPDGGMGHLVEAQATVRSLPELSERNGLP
ncbi:MAG: hypothetical protein WCF26_06300 [Candidatus Sulfotelmatobacter sp.]